MADSTLTVKDSTATTKTFSVAEDAGNSNALMSKTCPNDETGVALFSTAAAAADAMANPTAGVVKSATLLFNGSTWDRAKSVGSAGVQAVSLTGATGTALLPAAAVAADGAANPTATIVQAAGLVFNGTTWDRAKSVGSAGVQAVAPTGATGTALFAAAAAAAADFATPSSTSVNAINMVYDAVNDNWNRLREAAGTVGVQAVSAQETKTQYSTGASFNLPATPTDIVEIKGSATKTVRIKKISLSGLASATGIRLYTLSRRAASIDDGTPATPVVTEWDTANAAATAVVRHFTALGTPKAHEPASSVLDTFRLSFAAANAADKNMVLDFSDCPIVLRGVADCLVIADSGAALVGGENLSYSVTWTEE